MAIVKMSKLSVIGLEADKEEVLSALMELGVVELNEVGDKLLSEEWMSVARKDGREDEVSALEGRLSEVQTVLDMIDRYDTAKKPLFGTRQEVTRQEYESVLSEKGKVRDEIARLGGLCEQWNEERSRENVIASAQALLTPWLTYDLPLETEGTKSVRVTCGVIPSVADAEDLKKKVSEVSTASEVTVVAKDQEQIYLSILYMRNDEEAMLDVLKGFGYAQTTFKDMTGTASENMQRLNAELEKTKAEEKQLEAQFAASAAMKKEVRYYYDDLIMERDKAKASENLLKTDKAFYFDGWVIAERQKDVEAVLDKAGCWYEIKEPDKDEETPVLLKNKSIVVPFEAVTDLYSLPSSREIDPTPIFSAFYFIFFGMMFADMGYGAIMSIVCFAALKCFKLEGLFYKLVKMLAFCGLSVFMWGLLFGSFFGDIVKVISANFFGGSAAISPLWFDPLSNPMKMLIFSCLLGVVHLFVGMGINAYLLIRDGKVMDAVEQTFVWYAFITGLGLLLFGGDLFAAAPTIGKYLAIAGAVGIIGIPLIRGKGIGKAVGLWNLYGCTSYLGDILSYSRLLALGLASAVIAQVFNALGGMLGGGLLGVIGFIVIALIGHVFNFAINALGTFVHASRLQYVEFFGKFYTGGGNPFKPFKKNTKYVNIVSDTKEEK